MGVGHERTLIFQSDLGVQGRAPDSARSFKGDKGESFGPESRASHLRRARRMADEKRQESCPDLEPEIIPRS